MIFDILQIVITIGACYGASYLWKKYGPNSEKYTIYTAKDLIDNRQKHLDNSVEYLIPKIYKELDKAYKSGNTRVSITLPQHNYSQFEKTYLENRFRDSMKVTGPFKFYITTRGDGWYNLNVEAVES